MFAQKPKSSLPDDALSDVFAANLTPQKKHASTRNLIKRNYVLYLFLLPALIYILVFSYIPLYGIQLAFKTFDSALGIWGSPWVGFQWFEMFFSSPRFWTLIGNTLSISLFTLVVGFPIPIILALMLNSVKSQRFKKICQTATYLPHFISVVVLVGMLTAFLSPRSGFITTLLEPFFGERVYFMGEAQFFDPIYVWSSVWQDAGWSSIIYIAALAGVSPELHEAALMDGASRLKRIRYIDIPAIIPTITILLILRCGSIMSVGFEKVLLMQNNLNLQASEIISTYTYKLGLLQNQYSYSTAIGLFNNVINFTILVLVNRFAKKISGESLW